MLWDHTGQDCAHAGVGHPNTTISVLVGGTFHLSGESYELRCNYEGAEAGKGIRFCDRVK